MLKRGRLKESVTVSAPKRTRTVSTREVENTVDSSSPAQCPNSRRPVRWRSGPGGGKGRLQKRITCLTQSGTNNQKVGGARSIRAGPEVEGNRRIGYKTHGALPGYGAGGLPFRQNRRCGSTATALDSAISLNAQVGHQPVSRATAFYQGQYPWPNALEDRVELNCQPGRNHMYGGTWHPYQVRTSCFKLVAYEGGPGQTDPSTLTRRCPRTGARGNFSQSLTMAGGMRTIFTSAHGVLRHRRTVKNNQRARLPAAIHPVGALDPVAHG